MRLTRRDLLRASLGAGALLATSPGGALAEVLGPSSYSTSRRSRLFPEGTRLVHADLHNHSHLSDGAGDPMFVFESMRSAGLDVAALTDHATLSWSDPGVVDAACTAIDGDPEHGESQDCRSVAGLDEDRWAYAAELADAADDPGRFAAIRGFEWSSPFLGHVNVWLSERWIDPLHTAGIDSSGLGEHFREGGDVGAVIGERIDSVGYANPAHTGMIPFYEWLAADPSTPLVGGGADGIAGFNHPGRETGRFSYFRYHPAVADRFVSMEILNRRDDYLFQSFGDGQPSPLVQCLNNGWRVGLIGVTDEHGTEWGYPDGKGRTGLWVSELSRDGFREAMVARRAFATSLRGLRVDASARSLTATRNDGAPRGAGTRVRMGQALAHGQGPVVFELDIDRGPGWWGKELQVQVLRPGEEVPTVAHVEDVTVPSDDEPVISFQVALDAIDGDWVVLRVADPAMANDQLGPSGHPANLGAVAYTSPFWLDPDA